jgi:hypothetical protein
MLQPFVLIVSPKCIVKQAKVTAVIHLSFFVINNINSKMSRNKTRTDNIDWLLGHGSDVSLSIGNVTNHSLFARILFYYYNILNNNDHYQKWSCARTGCCYIWPALNYSCFMCCTLYFNDSIIFKLFKWELSSLDLQLQARLLAAAD